MATPVWFLGFTEILRDKYYINSLKVKCDTVAKCFQTCVLQPVRDPLFWKMSKFVLLARISNSELLI